MARSGMDLTLLLKAGTESALPSFALQDHSSGIPRNIEFGIYGCEGGRRMMNIFVIVGSSGLAAPSTADDHGYYLGSWVWI